MDRAPAALGGAPLTAAAGRYRLCWCPASSPCALAADFALDVGALSVRGPAPLEQARTCVSGRACAFQVGGLHVAAGDRMQVLDTCGLGEEGAARNPWLNVEQSTQVRLRVGPPVELMLEGRSW